jgi:hypothetical protein
MESSFKIGTAEYAQNYAMVQSAKLKADLDEINRILSSINLAENRLSEVLTSKEAYLTIRAALNEMLETRLRRIFNSEREIVTGTQFKSSVRGLFMGNDTGRACVSKLSLFITNGVIEAYRKNEIPIPRLTVSKLAEMRVKAENTSRQVAFEPYRMAEEMDRIIREGKSKDPRWNSSPIT